jgi:hypothetical protein
MGRAGGGQHLKLVARDLAHLGMTTECPMTHRTAEDLQAGTSVCHSWARIQGKLLLFLVAKLLHSWLCLLLLLGILGIVPLFQDTPRGLTKPQWFRIQHIILRCASLSPLFDEEVIRESETSNLQVYCSDNNQASESNNYWDMCRWTRNYLVWFKSCLFQLTSEKMSYSIRKWVLAT